jgi:hypothetical protein
MGSVVGKPARWRYLLGCLSFAILFGRPSYPLFQDFPFDLAHLWKLIGFYFV